MDDYRAAADFLTVIPAFYPVIPALYPVIPASFPPPSFPRKRESRGLRTPLGRPPSA